MQGKEKASLVVIGLSDYASFQIRFCKDDKKFMKLRSSLG